MEKLAKELFSMKMMTIAMVIFFIAVGGATFIESVHDTQSAKLYVYNALWFEVLLVYLSINLMVNIFRLELFKKGKIGMLMFHISFLVIMIGAGITRYISFEGTMRIPEGQSSNYIFSSEPYFWFKINDGVKQTPEDNYKKLYQSEWEMWNDFRYEVKFPGRKNPITIEYHKFLKNYKDTIVTHDSISGYALKFMRNGKDELLPENEFLMWGKLAVSFDKKNAMPGVELFRKNQKVLMKIMTEGKSLSMSSLTIEDRMKPNIFDSLASDLPMDTLIPLEAGKLYEIGGEQFVYKDLMRNTQKTKMKAEQKNEGKDILLVKITDGDKSMIQEVPGGDKSLPEDVFFSFNGLSYQMKYGAKIIPIPFSVKCKDFRLERYPGSNSPSSFESDLTIIDDRNNVNQDHSVFMNNVVDYDGYRFFQSSYFPDESGTILSVNHDWWGTNITYLGYFLMMIGMVLSMFSPTGRIRELIRLEKKSREKRAKLISTLLLLVSFSAFAQTPVDKHADHNHDHSEHTLTHSHDELHNHSTHNHSEKISQEKEQAPSTDLPTPILRVISKEHSDEIATLLVQNFQGRIIPFHTFADQFLRKIHRSNTLDTLNAVQTVLSMHMYPAYWLQKEVIYVPSKGGWRDSIQGRSYASFDELIDKKTGNFIYLETLKKAHQMPESRRGEREKRIIEIADRFETMNSAFTWGRMRILPVVGEAKDNWYSPYNQEVLHYDTMAPRVAFAYFLNVDEASNSGKYGTANDMLSLLKEYQYKVGGHVAPTKSKVEAEVRYTKMKIFSNATNLYSLLGILILIVFFIRIFTNPQGKMSKILLRTGQLLAILTVITFLYHGYGLYMRSYITGYMPWTNGYEAVVFIAWVAVLFGLIFSRNNIAVLGATNILAFFMLFVTEQSLMSPEITPLVPVLKSYWLQIHVSIITGSYGPLGIAAILGFLNWILYIVQTKSNGKKLTAYINEITYIAEICMIIGVFMLIIGTFLGGIWANESWGRYWGWDPKETWALVAVLVYAVILHLRYIPGAKGKFLLNTVAFWGYSSILFTFFGVNFYLTGLHSYAQGDELGVIPNWIWVTVGIFAVINVVAYLRKRMYSKK